MVIRKTIRLTYGVVGSLLLAGCYAPIESFDSNWIYAKRLELESGSQLEPAVQDTQQVLLELFGTPDEPRWPEFLGEFPQFYELVSLERLQRAAGPISSDESGTHFGLYRKHCIACHGISGNGLGPTSRLLNPYPRDFRMGKFKTKSTPIGRKPTRLDLHRLLRAGIPGTSMAAFELLDENDIAALMDYVIYLTVRGEVERALLTEAAFNLDYEAGERLFDADLKESAPEQYAEQWRQIQVVVMRSAQSWVDAPQHVPLVTGPPNGYPIWGVNNRSDVAAQSELEKSVANGRRLFQGSVANCSKCHGITAMGDGMTEDYDDWTKDWTVAAGLDPKDKEAIRPMLQLGALKPMSIQPRNLRSGVHRGGSRPVDLYYRIVHGIEGTPMPAAAMQPTNPLGLTEADVWDLVNYLLSLPLEPISLASAEAQLQIPESAE